MCIRDSSLSPPEFGITKPLEIKADTGTIVEVGALPPVMVDERFSGNLNMLFLPPVVSSVTGTVPMKAYNNYTRPFTQETVLDEIQSKSSGKATVFIKSDTFNGTDMYNFIVQAFVGINQEVKKYLVVDAGEFVDGDGNPSMQVYHLGFILKDSDPTTRKAISKFSRGFSIVFHNLSLIHI